MRTATTICLLPVAHIILSYLLFCAHAFGPTTTPSIVRTQQQHHGLLSKYASSSLTMVRGSKIDDETSSNRVSFFRWPSREEEGMMDDQSKLMINIEANHDEKSIVNGVDATEGMSPELMGAGAIAATIATITGIYYFSMMDISSQDLVGMAQQTFENPTEALEKVVQSIESMGPAGLAYFGVVYTIAEILAIPAIPLTASAGYLFGPVEGTIVVLLSASVAAAASFVIGRTLLRDYVESVLEEYPKFAKIDRAIGKEGFKLMLLLRLSPIFPFALSNYLYGASSINFNAFFWGTLLGFAPGTLAYVYTGYVGKALTESGDGTYPWYVYAGGLAVFAGILNAVADTATKIVEEMEEEEE